MVNTSRIPHFLSLHTDILNVIVLYSLDVEFHPPTLDTLKTLLSLLVCCKQLSITLSRDYNPSLYSDIFCLMWDVEPLRRRLGRLAVTCSLLANQLSHRTLLLGKLLQCVHDLEKEDSIHAITTTDLVTLFLWMTENDGRNMFQIRSFLGPTGLDNLLFALLTKQSTSHCGTQSVISYPDAGIIVALLWMNTEATAMESSHRMERILDILEPMTLTKLESQEAVRILYDYEGICCQVILPSRISFARLCIAERYDILSNRANSSQDIWPRPSWSCSSRFDDDVKRIFCIQDEQTKTSLNSSGLSVNEPTFQGLWRGSWYVASQSSLSTVFVTCRVMECQLREYLCTDPVQSVVFLDGDCISENNIVRAWFNAGVEIVEEMGKGSLTINDPLTERVYTYKRRTGHDAIYGAVDRIIVGETNAVQAGGPGDFNIHGRIRISDGKVALIRRPATPELRDFGVWVFVGYVYGGYDFVGEWTNTSTAKDAQAGSGWFRLARNALMY